MNGEDGLKKGLLDSEQRVINTFKKILNQKGITNNGDLANSFEASSDEDGMTISFYRYGEVIDNGRRRGSFPPIKPIKEWIKDRGLKLKAGQTHEQQAFAIATSIKKRGIRPRPFIQPALEDVAKNIIAPEIEIEMAKGIEKDIQRDLDKLPNELNLKM